MKVAPGSAHDHGGVTMCGSCGIYVAWQADVLTDLSLPPITPTRHGETKTLDPNFGYTGVADLEAGITDVA
jgi:hypothetical protein